MSVRHESVDIAPRTSGPSQSHSLEGREVAVEVVAVHDLPGGGCRQVQDAVPHPDAVVLEGQARSVGGGGRYVGGRSKWGGRCQSQDAAHTRMRLSCVRGGRAKVGGGYGGAVYTS